MKRENVKYKDIINLFSNLRKKQIELFIICALAITSDMFLTYQIQGLVDTIVNKDPFSNIVHVFLRIILWGFLSFTLTLYQTKRWHIFRYELVNSMRFNMYKSMIKKPMKYFNNSNSGDLASKVLNDGSGIAENAGIEIIMIVLNLFRIAFVLIILMSFNLTLGFVIVPVLIFYFALLIKINGNMRKYSLDERISIANVQQKLLESINGIKEIKMFNKYNYFCSIFDMALNKEYFSKIKKMIHCQVLMYALNNVMTIFLPILILLFGASLVYKNQISIGVLIAFYTYIAKLIEPLGNLADAYQGSKKALGAVDRVYEFVFEKDKIWGEKELNGSFGDLEIDIKKHAWKEKTVIEDLVLHIKAGEKVLIKGDSGKGKSTLLNLIMGYYEIDDGTISMNGINIKDMSLESLYHTILLLHQEPFVFEGTIMDNLTLSENYTQNEIQKVLNTTCLTEFIEERGLDYELKESGSNISGGQKQRLALARVLLRHPQIVILDEATSALDHKTESRLIDNLNNYLDENNITLIAVSHNNAFQGICSKQIIL